MDGHYTYIECIPPPSHFTGSPRVHFSLVHPWHWCASGWGFMTVNGAMTFLGCFHQGAHNPKAGMSTKLACKCV